MQMMPATSCSQRFTGIAVCAGFPVVDMSAAPHQNFICGYGQEIGQLDRRGDLDEERPGLFESALVESLSSDFVAHAAKLLADELLHQIARDRPPIVERRAMAEPLPDLRARNLRRGGVFHQVVDGNG